ncbi:MAG: hypothetical protein JSV88_32840 [Candidatus Aminicenantes bacterium]|nr:MAG: hypothetical protein JSV88_32840 [Candidatus Aminicenantes bacterium]
MKKSNIYTKIESAEFFYVLDYTSNLKTTNITTRQVFIFLENSCKKMDLPGIRN